MWSVTIDGRVIAKKNSKRLFRSRYTGKVGVASSAAFVRWHEDAMWQLKEHGIQCFSGPVAVTIDFSLKGRLDSDMDNMLGSILDLLEDAEVLENDKQVVEVAMRKRGGAAEFATTISVTPTA